MRIEKSKFLNNHSLPESSGVLFFYKGEKIIYSLLALDLYSKFNSLKKYIKENNDIFSLFSKTTHFDYLITDNLFDALIEEKTRLYNQKEPEYNSYFYNKFVYFAIDYKHVPYFSIKENTIEENKIFLGPFHSRFFIWDFISVMNDLYLYPACETKDFPCELYDKNRCYAPCLKDGIKDIALKNYLKINGKKIQELENKIKELGEKLEFNKEDNFKRKINIIKKYYDYLRFFYVTKSLKIKYDNIKISGGLIREIKKNNKMYEFEEYNLDYNQNEFLSIEKKQLNERWIIYNHFKNTYKNQMDEIYKKNKSFFK